jgi:hypothetical protein
MPENIIGTATAVRFALTLFWLWYY